MNSSKYSLEILVDKVIRYRLEKRNGYIKFETIPELIRYNEKFSLKVKYEVALLDNNLFKSMFGTMMVCSKDELVFINGFRDELDYYVKSWKKLILPKELSEAQTDLFNCTWFLLNYTII